MNPASQPPRLFLSFSNQDREWADRLRGILEKHYAFPIWEDFRIEPGSSWREKIEETLANTSMAVVLVSADYLASTFFMEAELPLLQAAAQSGLGIGWVLLRPCVWEEAPFASWQALLSTTRPLASLEPAEQEVALLKIAGSIEAILRQPASPPTSPNQQVIRWQVRQRFFREALAPGVDLPMAWIPSGTFEMGGPATELGSLEEERPIHSVTCGEFLMAVTPITQEQWRIVAGWPKQDRELDPAPFRHEGGDFPVDSISWQDAVEFCQRLSAHTGRYYELPTEAQWEYACRAGTRSAYSWGDTFSPQLASDAAEVSSLRSSEEASQGQPGSQPAGASTANLWGLRQMHGNLWEWCHDPWHRTYLNAPKTDWPWMDASEDPVTAQAHVLRGGSFADAPQRYRSASRVSSSAGIASECIGLRVCCLPVSTPYRRLFASRSQWRPVVSRSQCEQVFGNPLTNDQYEDLQRCLRRFRILTVPRIRLFLSMVGLVTGGLEQLLQEPAFDAEREVDERPAKRDSEDLLRFRGAGGLALYGRSSYVELAEVLKDPKVIEGAEYVAVHHPFTSAGFIWQKHRMNELLDIAEDPRDIFSILPGPPLRGASDPRLETLGRYQKRAVEALPDPR